VIGRNFWEHKIGGVAWSKIAGLMSWSQDTLGPNILSDFWRLNYLIKWCYTLVSARKIN
jgi:hypothetical protein